MLPKQYPIVITFETGTSTRACFRLVVPFDPRGNSPPKPPSLEVLKQNSLDEFYWHPIKQGSPNLERILISGLRAALGGVGVGAVEGDKPHVKIDLGYIRGFDAQ